MHTLPQSTPVFMRANMEIRCSIQLVSSAITAGTLQSTPSSNATVAMISGFVNNLHRANSFELHVFTVNAEHSSLSGITVKLKYNLLFRIDRQLLDHLFGLQMFRQSDLRPFIIQSPNSQEKSLRIS